MSNQPRAANVVAKTDVVCLRIDREDFEAHLGPCKALLERRAAEMHDQRMQMFGEQILADLLLVRAYFSK